MTPGLKQVGRSLSLRPHFTWQLDEGGVRDRGGSLQEAFLCVREGGVCFVVPLRQGLNWCEVHVSPTGLSHFLHGL